MDTTKRWDKTLANLNVRHVNVRPNASHGHPDYFAKAPGSKIPVQSNLSCSGYDVLFERIFQESLLLSCPLSDSQIEGSDVTPPIPSAFPTGTCIVVLRFPANIGSRQYKERILQS